MSWFAVFHPFITVMLIKQKRGPTYQFIRVQYTQTKMSLYSDDQKCVWLTPEQTLQNAEDTAFEVGKEACERSNVPTIKQMPSFYT